jgi:catechol 2,3-dioxygenase-like lactoylglutathione lyase family enzyme
MVTKKSSPPAALDLKAFVPARDFDLSKRFYRAIGFNEDWTNGEVAFFKNGGTGFLLRVEEDPTYALSLQMQIAVESADDWYEYVSPQLGQFGLSANPPVDRPWGARDFVLTDPSGVRWRITQARKG